MGQPLYCSAAHAGMWGESWYVGRERLWGWLYPLRVTQQYRLASMAAWLSSTGISTQISSLTTLQSVSPQSTAALTLGLLHNS